MEAWGVQSYFCNIFFDWAYGPLGAELDPEGSRFGFYTLETPGIASKIVKNGALQREKLTPKDFPIPTKTPI